MSKKQQLNNIYEIDTSVLLDLAKETHEIIYKKEEEKEEKDTSLDEKNSKSRNQIIETLEQLSKVEGIKAESREERFKVPSLRFVHIDTNSYDKMQTEIDDEAKKIFELYKLEVQLVENIDIKASSPEKFYIKITDENGNFVIIDLLKYQENIYDYTVDEEESIKNVLVRLKGVYSKEVVEASKAIATYISLALAYKETFYREYKVVGWSKINGDTIFKYDKIYSNHTPAYKGFCGEDWADAIKNNIDADEINGEIGEAIWCTFMAHTFNRSTVADIVLCAAASGIVRQLITNSKENNINMNIVGSKSSGKSTIQHLVMSFFGDPERLEGSFIDTENAEAQIRVERAIIPYVLDERALKVESSSGQKKATEMLLSIFREYEGKIKSRLGSQYNNSNASAYGAIISSSVDSIFEMIYNGGKTDDLGQYRRLIELILKNNDLFESAEHAEEANRIAHTYYGYGVGLFVNYILQIIKYQGIVLSIINLLGGIKKAKIVDVLDVSDIIISLIETELANQRITGKNKKLSFSIFDESKDDILADYGITNKAIVELINKPELYVQADPRVLFDSIESLVIHEINDIIDTLDADLRKEMRSSVKRFALLALTGYLLNNSIKYENDERFDVPLNACLNMDIAKMENYLLANLYTKLKERNVIVDKQELEREQQAKEEQEKQEEQKKQAKEQEYRELLFKLCDWLKANKEYFYLPKVNNRNQKDNELIGRYKEDIGAGTLKILIPNSETRLITWDTILNNLDLQGVDFLDIQYRGKKIPNISNKYSLEDLIKYNTEIVCLTEELQESKKPQINGKNAIGLRGDEYEINIRAIERAKEELQSQEESNNETN